MIKTFLVGIVLGLAASIAGAYYLPVVDQARERSIIRVQPNGGNAEAFHINIPMDQIASGAAGQATPLPPGMAWPEALADSSVSLYKLRNSNDVVIGVASRTAVRDDAFGSAVEWVLHLPARGSLYATMPASGSSVDGRSGRILSGTREFARIGGELTESYTRLGDGDDLRRGRIDLVTASIAAGDGA